VPLGTWRQTFLFSFLFSVILKLDQKIAKDRRVIPDPIDDRKFHEWKESGKSGILLGIRLNPQKCNYWLTRWAQENYSAQTQCPSVSESRTRTPMQQSLGPHEEMKTDKSSWPKDRSSGLDNGPSWRGHRKGYENEIKKIQNCKNSLSTDTSGLCLKSTKGHVCWWAQRAGR